MTERKRLPHGQLREAIREFLATRGEPASIAEITEGVRDKVGEAPKSSYRSTLQNEAYFVRVSRGVFRLKEDI